MAREDFSAQAEIGDDGVGAGFIPARTALLGMALTLSQ